MSRKPPGIDRRALKRQLSERRRAMRAALAEKRRATDRGRPRRRLLVVALLLLLLLLLRDCACQEPPQLTGPAPEPLPAAAAEPGPTEPGPAPIKPGRIGRRDRPEYSSAPPEALPWLAEFRMQVAARSPRLAECFVGIEEPGALRWTTSVEPRSGQVSEHDLEPTLSSAELTRQQRTCAIAVLSDPVYRLQTDDERATPARVGLVIEF